MSVVQANSAPIETLWISVTSWTAFLFLGIQGKSGISGTKAFEVRRLVYAAFSRHYLTRNTRSTWFERAEKILNALSTDFHSATLCVWLALLVQGRALNRSVIFQVKSQYTALPYTTDYYFCNLKFGKSSMVLLTVHKTPVSMYRRSLFGSYPLDTKEI